MKEGGVTHATRGGEGLYRKKGEMVSHVERDSVGEWETARRGMHEDQSVRIGSTHSRGIHR